MKFSIQKTLLIISLTVGLIDSYSQERREGISIIPAPEQMVMTNVSYTITPKTKIIIDDGNPDALRVANMLAEKFKTATGFSLSITEMKKNSSVQNSILFSSINADTSLGREGYELSVTNERVVIKAVEAAGMFYAMQTIFQLLPPEIESSSIAKGISWKIPGAEIRDTPRFKWRGMHLDVCRHYMPLEFIKKYIDNMAMHKLNTFHWHLTEDQGWRIEIKKYPKLTEVGAWRKETLIGHVKDKPHKFDGKRHGGFYTQEQAKEIVQYAKDRFITVVPEIEMPGHAKAAIAAYPELGVTGKPVEVATYWGIFPDIFNVEESTFKFLEDVLTEVMDIFPSEYIHIGGDEAIKDQWKASDKIQQKIKELGLQDEHQLQSYFIKRMEKFVNSKGRKLIGWDEILEGGLAPNATVMSWQGVEGGIAAARSNHDVIMTPAQYLYFWTYQADPATEPFAFGGYIPLQKVYSFEPIPAELTADQSKYILGAQGCAWTEYMETPRDVEYMVFPRMSALSEIVWSPKGSKDWKDFTTRMTKQYKRYDQRKINYAKVPFDIPMELK